MSVQICHIDGFFEFAAVVSEAMDVDEPGEGSSQIKEEPRAAENHVLDDKQKDAKLRLFKTSE